MANCLDSSGVISACNTVLASKLDVEDTESAVISSEAILASKALSITLIFTRLSIAVAVVAPEATVSPLVILGGRPDDPDIFALRN